MIQGFIYILSVFKNLTPRGCVEDDEVDNDSHLWSERFTWGIFRPDIRNIQPRKGTSPCQLLDIL